MNAGSETGYTWRNDQVSYRLKEAAANRIKGQILAETRTPAAFWLSPLTSLLAAAVLTVSTGGGAMAAQCRHVSYPFCFTSQTCNTCPGNAQGLKLPDEVIRMHPDDVASTVNSLRSYGFTCLHATTPAGSYTRFSSVSAGSETSLCLRQDESGLSDVIQLLPIEADR